MSEHTTTEREGHAIRTLEDQSLTSLKNAFKSLNLLNTFYSENIATSSEVAELEILIRSIQNRLQYKRSKVNIFT